MYKTKEARSLRDRAAYAAMSPEKKAARLAQCRAWNAANKELRKKYTHSTSAERAAYMREWRAKNPDNVRATRSKSYENGGREYQAAYYAARKESLKPVRKANYKAWAAANSHKVAAYAAERRARELQATPSWLTPDDFWLIEEIYDLCALRTRLTGVEHHVDHFYPLKGKTGCGLHVPFNLRVIPARLNLLKRNHAPAH
jgi:hypothetical protein